MQSKSINNNPQEPPLSTFLKPRHNRIQRIKNSVTSITKTVLDYFRPFLTNKKKIPDQSLDQSIVDDNLQSLPKDKAAVLKQKKMRKKNFNIIKFEDVSSDSQVQQVFLHKKDKKKKKEKKNGSNQLGQSIQKQEENQVSKTKLKKVNGKQPKQKQPKAKYFKQKIPYCQIILQPSPTRVFKKAKISNDFQNKINRNSTIPKQNTKLKKENNSTQFKNVQLSYSQQSSQSLNIEMESEKYVDIQGDFDLRDQIMRNIYQRKFQPQDNDQVSSISQSRKRVKLSENMNTLKKISTQKQKFYLQTVQNMNEIIKDYYSYSDRQKTIRQRYQAYERYIYQQGNSLVKLENKLLSLKSNIGSQNRTEKFKREYQPVKVIVKQNKINLNLDSILKVVRQTQLKPPPPAEIPSTDPIITEEKEKQPSKQELSLNKGLFGSNNPPIFFNSNKSSQKEENIFEQKKELFPSNLFNTNRQVSSSICSESGRILFAKSQPEKKPSLFGGFNLSKKNQNPVNQVSQQKKPQQKINSQVIDVKQQEQQAQKEKEKNSEEKVQQIKNPLIKSEPQQKKKQPTVLKQNPFLKKPSGSLNIIDVIRNNTINPFFGSSVSESSFPMTPIKPPSEDSKESDNDHFSRPVRPIQNILQGITQKASRQASQKIVQHQQQSSHDDQSSMFDQSQQSASKNQAQSCSVNQSPQHPAVNKLGPVIFNNPLTTPANLFTQQNTFMPQVDIQKSLSMFGQVQNQSANLWGASKDQLKKGSSSSSRSKKSKQQRVYN